MQLMAPEGRDAVQGRVLPAKRHTQAATGVLRSPDPASLPFLP